jgi:hypothetical protein
MQRRQYIVLQIPPWFQRIHQPALCIKYILFEYQEKFLFIDKAQNFKVALIGDIFSHENQEPVGHNTFTEN